MAGAPEVDPFFGRAKKLGPSNEVLRMSIWDSFVAQKGYTSDTHVDIVMDKFQVHGVLHIGHRLGGVRNGLSARRRRISFREWLWVFDRIGVAGG